MRTTAFLLSFTLVTLAGCGGDDGNVRPQSIASAPRTATDAAAANPARTRMAITEAATSLPRFGSITQSSNHGVSGITSDAASTTFDGSGLAVTVTRQDGSSLQLNSETDTVPGYAPTGASPIAGHSLRAWGMARSSDTSVSIGSAAVTSHNSDPT